MKLTNAEIIKKDQAKDTGQLLENARNDEQNIEFKAQKAEEDARSLEMVLMQAQAAHERKEEAERHGKETSEKIAELAG